MDKFQCSLSNHIVYPQNPYYVITQHGYFKFQPGGKVWQSKQSSERRADRLQRFDIKMQKRASAGNYGSMVTHDTCTTASS